MFYRKSINPCYYASCSVPYLIFYDQLYSTLIGFVHFQYCLWLLVINFRPMAILDAIRLCAFARRRFPKSLRFRKSGLHDLSRFSGNPIGAQYNSK